MEPTLDELRKNYEEFDDEKLLRMATEQATILRPEALELLKEIIKERNLSVNIDKAVEIQFRAIDENTLIKYADILRKLPCPVCGTMFEKLNATMTSSVVSIVFITNTDNKLLIACPDCLDKANNAAIIKSSILGWWSVHGIFKTIKAIFFNSNMKKQNRLDDPNELLKSFISSNIGTVEANIGNKAELESIITYL